MDQQRKVSEPPLRPRIRPGLAVLRRRPGELQVGLDPRRGAVIADLPESVITAVTRLTGQVTSEALLAEVGADADVLRALLCQLEARGLVEEADVTIPNRLLAERAPDLRTTAAVAVHGEGRLAVSIACLLATAGVGWVHVAAKGSVLPEDVGTGYLADDVGRPRAYAAMDAVRRASSSVKIGRFTARRRPDIVVLTDAVVPDPELVDVLVATQVPHLPVHIRDGVGIVGPLVVPGMTSCLRCADLRRSQIDGCWPGIAAQLAGRPQPADLACTQATAALAAGQVLETLSWSRSAHPRPRTWNTTVEIDLAAAQTQYRGWQPHSACPCQTARRAS
jgi:bacteriocin biosynthesis cyclodehydratase domain-containing protein